MIDSTADLDATRAQFVAAIPLNRMGRPEEIAAAALFLASDEASFVPAPNSVSTAGWHRSNDRPGGSTSAHPVAERLWMQSINRAEAAVRSREPTELQNERIPRCV